MKSQKPVRYSGMVAMMMLALAAVTTASQAAAVKQILGFTSMVGVDGAFVSHNPIRGVLGDELPWEIGSVRGSLTTDGHLRVSVRGLVFSNYPSVPADLRGINDEAQ